MNSAGGDALLKCSVQKKTWGNPTLGKLYIRYLLLTLPGGVLFEIVCP